MRTRNLKIETWQKRGNGPWIVLRFVPPPTREDVNLRLAEVIFRPVAGGQINSAAISQKEWNRYNGCRATAIFLLLAAAKRDKGSSPDEELPIMESPVRPSWLSTFCDLVQEKKFQNSGWAKFVFGITSQKMSGQVKNGLARIAKVRGRTEKSTNDKEKINRIGANPDSKKATVYLRTSNLQPKNILVLVQNLEAAPTNEGESDPKKLMRMAAALESAEKKWWKIIPDAEAVGDAPQLTTVNTALQNQAGNLVAKEPDQTSLPEKKPAEKTEAIGGEKHIKTPEAAIGTALSTEGEDSPQEKPATKAKDLANQEGVPPKEEPTKTATAVETFNRLCRQGQMTLENLKPATRLALFWTLRGEWYLPMDDNEMDKLRDASAVDEVFKVDLGLAENENSFRADTDHPRVQKAVTALMEIKRFLSNPDNASFVKRFREKYDFPPSLRSKDFWKKFLAVV